MSTTIDYYELLECERTADDATIKSRYRKLAMQYHPDRNAGCKDSEAKFKAISEAYDCLKDPQKRAAYDRYGHAAFQQGMGGGRWRRRAGFRRLFRHFRKRLRRFHGWRAWRRPATGRRGATCATTWKSRSKRPSTASRPRSPSMFGRVRHLRRHRRQGWDQRQDLSALRWPWQGPRAAGIFRGRADLPGLPGCRPDHRRSLPRLSRRGAVSRRPRRWPSTSRRASTRARASACPARVRRARVVLLRATFTSSSM